MVVNLSIYIYTHMNFHVWALSDSASCCCAASRNRPTPLFSPASSSSDRADVQLQGYHKTYSHQQVFSQQQGTDRAHRARVSIVSLTRSVCCLLWSFMTFIISVLLQGCVYGEGKAGQPVSDGGFEPASYFTNPAASHSTGKTDRQQSNGVHVHQSQCTLAGQRVSETTPFRMSISHSHPPHAVIGQLCWGEKGARVWTSLSGAFLFLFFCHFSCEHLSATLRLDYRRNCENVLLYHHITMSAPLPSSEYIWNNYKHFHMMCSDNTLHELGLRA